MSSKVVAVTSDESLVAVVVNPVSSDTLFRIRDGIQIDIWSTITGTLQTTLYYTPTSNKKTTNRIDSDDDDENEEYRSIDDTFLRMVFIKKNASLLVAAIYTQTILVWDMNRALLTHIIPANHSANTKKNKKSKRTVRFVDAIESNNNSTSTNTVIVDVLLQGQKHSDPNEKKLYIQAYDLLSGTALGDTKIKIGTISTDENMDTKAVLAVTNDNTILILSNALSSDSSISIRGIDRTTGSKVFKLSASTLLESSSSSSSSFVPSYSATNMILSTHGLYGATVVQGKVVLLAGELSNDDYKKSVPWSTLKPSSSNTSSSSKRTILGNEIRVTTTGTLSAPTVQIRTVDSVVDNNKQRILVLVNNKSLYEVLVDTRKGLYEIISRIEIHINADLQRCLVYLMKLSSIPSLLSIISNGRGQYQLQSLSVNEKATTKKLTIQWNTTDVYGLNSTSNNDTTQDSKQSSQATIILGPGQQGGEALGVIDIDTMASNKKRKMSIDNESGNDETITNGKSFTNPVHIERWKGLQDILNEDHAKEQQLDNEISTEHKSYIIKNDLLSVDTLTKFISDRVVVAAIKDKQQQQQSDNYLDILLAIKNQTIIQSIFQQELLSKYEVSILWDLLIQRLESVCNGSNDTTTSLKSNKKHKGSIRHRILYHIQIEQITMWLKHIIKYCKSDDVFDHRDIKIQKFHESFLFDKISIVLPELLKLHGQLSF